MRKSLLSVDWWLLLPMIVLIVVSLTTLASLNIGLFRLQLINTILGVGIFFLVSNIRFNALQQFAFPIYIGSLIALGIVLFIGFESHGAVRWVQLFGASIQFSEICKPLLALALASFLSEHENSRARYLFVAGLLLVPIVLLIYLQPDLGDAIIYFLVTLFVLVVYGYKAKWFITGVIPILVGLPLFWARLHDYQRQRILTFLHPASDQSGASYNAMQALIAVGSGMFIGRGLSEGTQSGLRFLPERHTDFIFASLTEELGFIGGIIVIAAFAVLLFRMFVLFQEAEGNYAKLFLAAAFFLLMIHMFLNIGMNLGIVPIVGVTLPFVSFGGSSFLANALLLGLVASVGKTIRKHEVLEIR